MTVHRRCPRCEGGPMHVGLAAVFQNPKKARSDIDVYRNELRLAAEAEPLGFESVWGVEHHFTDYTMCPDVLQFLTYMAGRTQRAQLGSMVVVLPWHDPLRRRRSLDARQHLRWTPDPGPGSWRRPRRVRRLPALDGRVPRALRGIRGDAAARPGGGLLRVRRPVRPPATRGDPPGAVQDLPRPDLRRGRLAGVDADHGEARGGHPRHPAEALARGRQGARRLPHDVPGHQPDGGATDRVRGLDLLRREPGAEGPARAHGRWRLRPV